jgi:hypothetical protein
MTNKSLTKIEKLKKQKEVIAARIQKMEAIEKHKERKRDTRRKILIGSYYLDKAKKENNLSEINSIMAKFLKRDSDRVLFDLPVKKSKNE